MTTEKSTHTEAATADRRPVCPRCGEPTARIAGNGETVHLWTVSISCRPTHA